MDDTYADPAIIPAILLSDHAIREMGTGKMTLVGIFNSWSCPVFPFTTPAFCVATSVSNFVPGTKGVTIVARIEQKTSGLVIGNVAAQVVFPEGKIDRNGVVDLPLMIPSIVIPQPGSYRVVVLANDEKIGERSVEVLLAKPSGTVLPT